MIGLTVHKLYVLSLDYGILFKIQNRNIRFVHLIYFFVIGVAVRSTMDATITNTYCAVISRLSDQARSTIRDLDPTNDITFLRIRSKKNEILLAPGNAVVNAIVVVERHFFFPFCRQGVQLGGYSKSYN